MAEASSSRRHDGGGGVGSGGDDDAAAEAGPGARALAAAAARMEMLRKDNEQLIKVYIAQAVEAAKAEAAQVLKESKQEAAEAIRAARSEAAEAAKAAEKAKTDGEILKQEIDEWKSRAEKNRKWAESAEASGSRDLVAAQREIARLESQVQDLEIHLEQGVNERKLEVERWMEKVSNLQEKVALQRQFMMKAGYESAIDSQGHAPLANLTNNI
ncbi:Hypothetical Protein FCC1311_109582 [Hondaea fermentalgiana]|uniref:Uncharacterized protein n=1 Tax=Hondaea fermentalgiana TaxID=2315210 RepID=A0A2R5GV63_9STRA|nr:Hypothetical Protein FCC1311_109582 [Hondaea fermentalgiana]|eukprot:GBG34736.1 Hypothetical Protein FCC1311_109582 [Hondaea fermentalgiana]